MKLLVAIPCFNEEKTISKVIGDVPKKIQGISEINILVMDDGSEDASAMVAKECKAEVHSFPKNRGLGWVFTKSVSVALSKKVDILVTIDGDGQFKAKDISKLIKPIIAKEADFVTCSRFIDKDLTPNMSVIKLWGNRFMSKFISMLIKRKFYDVSCGFRAYSREALLNVNLFGKFTYTQEAFLDLAYKGIRIKEIPLKVRAKRQFGRSKISDNLLAYGYKTLKIIFRTLRDYKPLKFFGSLGLIIFMIGFVFDFFLLYHYVFTHSLSPYKSLGFIGGFLNAIGLVILVLALVADMLERIRLNQEKILYLQKKREYEID